MSDETKKSPYEVVIGLEVHAHLWTRTKMFCACPRPRQSNIEPNTLTCPVCLGMPGVLPVINEEALRAALEVALALNCTIPPVTHFDRKNYYYPDLPKNYQISQNYNPLGRDGWMDVEFGQAQVAWETGKQQSDSVVRLVDWQTKRVGIDNVHLEEDAGKSVHPKTAAGRKSGIDLNRAGTPLLEVVTKPDMRSVEELRAFVQDLRKMLRDLGTSECRMEEGQLRFEVSVSLRPAGQKELGTRVEVKNLNSVRSVLAAARYEAERQGALLDAGEPVARETRLWDELELVTRTMRSKELAHNYRYFPEPDLVPVEVTEEMLAAARAKLRDLPLARRKRFKEMLVRGGAPASPAKPWTPDSEATAEDRATLLAAEERDVGDYCEATVEAGADANAAFNWVMVELLRELNDRGISLQDGGAEAEAVLARLASPEFAQHTARLLEVLAAGVVNRASARKVFAEMMDGGRVDPDIIIREKGLEQIRDTGELEQAVARVIAENPKPVADYRAGKKQAFAFLVGQVMRVTKGKANPQLASQLLEQALAQEK
jgi:aspartyl-tRNA(Asn)/glutamyl-tRNA(Gln) amidotransferase subunit B